MRQRTLLSAALLVVAACSDQPTGLEPTPAPHPSFDRNEVEQVAPTGTGATTITLVERNISGNGAAVCSSGEVGRGPTGWKVDGASGTTRDGLKFTVTDGKYLAFSRVSGDNVVTAVVVKGGEFTYVYDYGAGATSGAGLRAPLNGGGNVPTISHYTFCYQPGPPSITKVLTSVKTVDGNTMPVDPAWSAGGPVIIPQGETRWLYYTISYSIPGGGKGTVTESPTSVCATLGAGFGCSFDTGIFQPAATITGSGADMRYTWNVTGTGTITVILDITNSGACGVRDDVENTAKLTATGGSSASATAKVEILGVCVQKVLTDVKSSAAGMPTDPVWKANPGTVIIPSGDTRWLYYEIRYQLPTGFQASVSELASAVCASLGPKIGCSFDTGHFTPGFTSGGGAYTWNPVAGSGAITVVIDITNSGGCGQGFTNTAALRTTGGAHIGNASNTVQLQLQGCPQS
jgi:hypothetical protein